MKLILSILFALVSTSAQANTCLQQVTDSELLSEVSNRMNNGAGSQNLTLFMTFTCHSNELTIEAVTEHGDESSVTLGASSAFGCNEVAKKATTNKSNLNGKAAMVAVCGSNQLKRAIIQVNGVVKALSVVDLNSASACEEKAMEINSISNAPGGSDSIKF